MQMKDYVSGTRFANLVDSLAALTKDHFLFTTNYDTLLAQSTGLLPICIRNVEISASSFLIGSPKLHDFVYHLHGLYYDHRDFVLTKSQYENTAASFIGFMTNVVNNKNLVFVGCGAGLYDIHFMRLWADAALYQRAKTPYVLVTGSSDKDKETALAHIVGGAHHYWYGRWQSVEHVISGVATAGLHETLQWMRKSIKVVSYGESHDDLAGFFEAILH